MVLAFAGFILLLQHPLAGSILFLISFILISTHYRLAIDFNAKVYHDYIWILGIKNGDKTKFEYVEYLFITKSKVSQSMNSLLSSSTFKKAVYNGYLKFSGDDKVHLMTKDDKEKLVAKLRPMSGELGVRIIDYSAGEPREI